METQMTFPGSASPKVRFAAAAAVFAALYFVTAELTSSLAGDVGIAVLWPASGVYLGVMLVAPRRLWPALAVGAGVGSLAAYSHAGSSLELSVAFAVPSSAEGLLGAVLVERIVRGRFRLRGLHDVSALVVGSAIATALVALSAGAVATQTFGVSFAESWLRWWSADALGVLAVAPLVIALAHSRGERPPAAELRYGAAVIAFVALAVWAKPSGAAAMAGGALVLPVLLWAGWRWGPRAAALGGTGVALAAMNLASGSDLLGGGTLDSDVHVLQAFLAALLVSSLSFAAAVADWRRERVAAVRSSGRLRAVTESTPDAYVTVDSGGLITGWSARAEAMFGIDSGDVTGRSLESIAPGVGPITPTPNARELTLLARHRSGREFPAALTVRPGIDGDEGLWHVFIRDLTETERLGKELGGTARDLERATSRIDELSAKLEERTADLDDLKDTLAATNRELGRVKRDAEAAGRDGAAAASARDRARAESERSAREADRLRADLARATGDLSRARAELSNTAGDLSRTRAAAETLAKELDNTRAEQTQLANELDRSRAENAQTADELDRARAENAQTADELDRARAENAQTADELDRARAENAQTADELDRARAENTQTADELDRARTGHAQTADELDRTRAEHSQLANELHQTRAEHAQMADELGGVGAEQAQLADELDRARAEQAWLADELDRAAAALAVAEAERRLVAEHGTELIARYDERGVCLAASAGARGLLGYEPDQLVGRPGAELVHPEDRARLLRARAGQAETTFRARLRNSAGEYVPVEVSFRPSAGQAGRLGEVTTVARPLVERRADDDAGRIAETRFRSLFGTLPHASALIGADGRIRRANLALARLIGYSADQLEGTALGTLVDDEDAVVFAGRLRQVATGQVATLRLEQEIAHASGRTVRVELRVTPLPSGDANGGVRLHELVVHFEDVRRETRLTSAVA
jgi:PAS domain S-box-containing protein